MSASSASSSASLGVPPLSNNPTGSATGLRVQVSLPAASNGEASSALVVVGEGETPVCAVKRAVAAKTGLSPLLQRVQSVPSFAGVDGINSSMLHVSVTQRPARNPAHTLRVQLMSEQRVAGVSAWDVPVDAASDSVLDLKFLLATQPAFVQANLRPDHMKLYARRVGQVARAELLDGQTLREAGVFALPAGSGVVRLMFEFPSGVPGHGMIHATRPTINERADPSQSTMGEIFLTAVRTHPNRPFLGTRTYLDVNKPSERGPYSFITYAQAGVRVNHIGAGLRALGVQPQQSVGIVSANRSEWTLTDMGCNVQAFVSVPLYDTLGPDAIQYIINHASVRAVVASVKELKALAAIRPHTPSLEFVIAMDDTPFDKKQLDKLDRALYSYRLSELEDMGSKALDKFPAGVSHSKPSDVHTSQLRH
jgi:hypothetical protein